MLATVLLSSLALAAPSTWDGVNPYRCDLQQAGLTATVQHPEADPFCIEFDKTHQNVTDLGVVDFLSQEPARVALAVPKCFYFQSDHWRGSVVQDDGTTETYAFDGHYYFNKATGDGGAWVTHASINGKPPGGETGGVTTHNAAEVEPDCVAEAKAHPEIYASTPLAPGHACVNPAGPTTRRRLGPIALGTIDSDVRQRLGDPLATERGFLRYCADGGGRYLVGQSGDRSGDLGTDPNARTVIIVTTARALRTQKPRKGVLVGPHKRWLAITRLRGARLRAALRRAGVRGRATTSSLRRAAS